MHAGALGWVGMISFGILYWLVPRLWNRPLAYPSWATTHFWLATIGIVLYTVSMWAAGLTEGLAVAGVRRRRPAQVSELRGHRAAAAARSTGCGSWAGGMYLIGAIMMAWNFITTRRERRQPDPAPAPPRRDLKERRRWRATNSGNGVAPPRLEGKGALFAVLTTVAILIGGLVEIVPMFTRQARPGALWRA